MYDVRLNYVRANERRFFGGSRYNFEQALARFVRHIAGSEMSRHRVVVIVVAVGSADDGVIAVVIALAHGRRTYQRLCDRVAKKHDIEFFSVVVASRKSERA